MDFLDRLKDFLEGLSFTPDVINIGSYRESGNDIAIRPTPTAIADQYQSKEKIYPFSFQVLVHMDNNIEAYTTIEKLRSELANLNSESIVSDNDSFDLITIECTSTPSYVQKTNYGSLWNAIFTADIHIRR